jgi:serine/threonine-protein kinase
MHSDKVALKSKVATPPSRMGYFLSRRYAKIRHGPPSAGSLREGDFMRFFAELRRRGVLKIATGYLVVSWLTLEIGHTLFNVFELPHSGLQFVFALLAVGFPLSLLGAWQGWFGPALQGESQQGGHAADGHHGVSHHDGPWVAGVFGAVAIFAVAVAIGVRFFGMAHPAHGGGEAGSPSVPAVRQEAMPAAFSPPAHSVAVLPFVNMSGEPGQDYFSDGLSEELLNSLAGIRDLQVAARTSSFSFKGKDPKLADVARELNVGAILEGGVRKDKGHVRITARLVDAVTGFDLWSQSYDRDLKNVLALQTEIAGAVTKSLKAALLPSAAAALELGGTNSASALDSYLQGEGIDVISKETQLAQIAAFDKAIRIDPGFAKAYAAKAISLAHYAGSYEPASNARLVGEQALEIAKKAENLAPDLVDAHLAIARIQAGNLLEFAQGMLEYQRALALAPGDARVLSAAARFFAGIGHHEVAQAYALRALTLDPINGESFENLGYVYLFAHRDSEAVAAYSHALSRNPNIHWAAGLRGIAYLGLGQWESARESCSAPPQSWVGHTCLAIAYDKLGHKSEAQSMVTQMKAEQGDAMAYQFASIYAQWGEISEALDWLEAAYRLKDPGLAWLKVDLLLDPLRKEARFQDVERKLNFPS